MSAGALKAEAEGACVHKFGGHPSFINLVVRERAAAKILRAALLRKSLRASERATTRRGEESEEMINVRCQVGIKIIISARGV